jgi:glutamate-1-semialdehyde 2,1-aminomutase
MWTNLSKRPEMFLPDNWPSYFSKAKRCKIGDLDNNVLLDMSVMGIGTNTLYNTP